MNDYSKLFDTLATIEDENFRMHELQDYVIDHGVLRITYRDDLKKLSDILGPGAYWHKPGHYDVSAIVTGTILGTSGFWPMRPGRENMTELYVSLIWGGDIIAHVNLAKLLGWAIEDN